MILFHGSNQVIDKPKLIYQNRFLDFGNGFYTTTNREQAENFAQKVVLRKKDGKPFVSVYEIDEIYLKDLSILEFKSANEQWLDYVSQNRNGEYNGDKFDLIIGAVANDDVYQTFLLYSQKILTKEQTLETLKIKKLYNQYVFASEKALKYLKFLGTTEGLYGE